MSSLPSSLPSLASSSSSMSNCPVVAVEGIIGAGKSTFCELAERDLRLLYVPEPVAENPYLDRFYQAPDVWALHMQMWLVARRVQAIVHAKQNLGMCHGLLVDRSIIGDRVFAEMHKKNGNISKHMWPIYDDFFSIMSTLIEPPHMIVYIGVTPHEAMAHVKKRGRASEGKGVTLEYQQELKREYDRMIDRVGNGTDSWAGKTAVIKVPGYLDESGMANVMAQVGDWIQGFRKRS